MTVVSAPVAPDGDVAGAPTDLVVTFADIDPLVDGIGLRAGATVQVFLPEEIVNTGDRPVASTGSSPGCTPPLVSGCSTAVLLQGWPQSPVPPFPTITYDDDEHAIVATANAEIQPDPDEDEVIEGEAKFRIRKRLRPTITPNSQGNIGPEPPPPFPNPLYQFVAPNDSSLNMRFYLWDGDGEALTGVDFAPGSDRRRLLVDETGKAVGVVRVRAPRGATNWSLGSNGPAVPANAFVTGLPIGLLTAALDTDPAVTGTYRLSFRLFGGSSVTHVIRVG